MAAELVAGAFVDVDVSVVNDTAVVVLSVMITGLVVVCVVTVALLACRFLKYSFTEASCRAISNRRVASSGSSL